MHFFCRKITRFMQYSYIFIESKSWKIFLRVYKIYQILVKWISKNISFVRCYISRYIWNIMLSFLKKMEKTIKTYNLPLFYVFIKQKCRNYIRKMWLSDPNIFLWLFNSNRKVKENYFSWTKHIADFIIKLAIDFWNNSQIAVNPNINVRLKFK